MVGTTACAIGCSLLLSQHACGGGTEGASHPQGVTHCRVTHLGKAEGG